MARRQDRAIGLRHAQQAFVMRHPAAARLHDGLEGQHQAIVLQGLHHIVGDGHVAQSRRFAAGGRLMGGKAVAAIGARLVQSLLGAQHGFLAGVRGRRQPHRAHADGGGDHAAARLHDTAAHRSAQPRRHDRDFLFRAVLQDHAELVAGGAADHVAAAQGAGQPLAHAHDHFFAGIEAEAVIDHRQAIDGGDQEGAGAVLGLGAFDGAGQFLAQRIAVQMPGQFIARRQIGQAAHFAEALRDVAHHPAEAQRAAVGVGDAGAG